MVLTWVFLPPETFSLITFGNAHLSYPRLSNFDHFLDILHYDFAELQKSPKTVWQTQIKFLKTSFGSYLWRFHVSLINPDSDQTFIFSSEKPHFDHLLLNFEPNINTGEVTNNARQLLEQNSSIGKRFNRDKLEKVSRAFGVCFFSF